MSSSPVFVESEPRAATARFTPDTVHLWRIRYARSMGRAPLLDLLGAYLGVPASAVELEHDARGKPHLLESPGSGGAALQFNWSHSGDYALIALARDVAPGVDIERLAKQPRASEIAERYFGAAEADALATLAPSARNHAFIGLWCAKEAVLKAAGAGLSFGLGRVVFEPRDAGNWSLAGTDPTLGRPEEWALHGLEPVAGYRGALAWRGGDRTIMALRPPDGETSSGT